jgi:hypothetical protein
MNMNTANRQDTDLIIAIAQRAEALYIRVNRSAEGFNRLALIMDLDACHSNACPLKLEALLAAGDADFAHDVFGIVRHFDRERHVLRDCFLPRYWDPQVNTQPGALIEL